MKRLKTFLVILGICLSLFPLTAGESVTVRGMKIPINGSMDSIDGVPVISLRGTPWEQGFAYGYLYQEKIVRFFDAFLAAGKIMNLDQYEKSRFKLSFFSIPSSFESEMRGMMDGIEARAGGPVEAPAMKRNLWYEDLVMANCMGEMSRFRMACSSFAAWGPMTADGGTISGRNYEWPLCESLLRVQVVLVRLPPPDSGKLGTVSVFYPALLGVISAMNEEGVTLSTHDACLTDGNGFTVRKPDDHYFVCTNRYFERDPASKLQACWRFDKLNGQLKEMDEVDLEKAWKLEESVGLKGTATYHRVIFEPNKRKMHVAFPADGEPVKVVTLDVAGLLAGARAKASH